MKKTLLPLIIGLAALTGQAQYALDPHVIACGGGTSTAGVYAVTGTIGQPDAGAMSGGNFALQGGFWNVIAAVQTPGAPLLSVTRSNTAALVAWSKADPDWKLEFTTNLVKAGTNTWRLIPPPYPTNATDCVVSEPAPAGNKFYRLHKP